MRTNERTAAPYPEVADDLLPTRLDLQHQENELCKAARSYGAIASPFLNRMPEQVPCSNELRDRRVALLDAATLYARALREDRVDEDAEPATLRDYLAGIGVGLAVLAFFLAGIYGWSFFQ